MQYGICHLNCSAVRAEASGKSEMVTQLLYGDHFEIIDHQKDWYKIRIASDHYEGWIAAKQCVLVSEESFYTYHKKPDYFVGDLIEFFTSARQQLIPVSLGANLKANVLFGNSYEGESSQGKKEKKAFLQTAFLYLNAPCLWGGKTPFGIDCSGFTQMVYKLNGYSLKRDAHQQALQGQPLSFIEESEVGDLAFFDNQEGEIIHVGIIMEDNYIIHVHEKVRIDRLDHSGIFNVDTRQYSHNLRVIKKIV